MNWKKYENDILQYFSTNYPDTSIKHNAKAYGRYSKKDRQVDILIEGKKMGDVGSKTT